MKTTKESVKIYSGPEAVVRLLKLKLEEIGINAITRDEHSDIFIGITPPKFDLLVNDDDLDRAKPVIDDFIADETPEISG